MVSGHGKSDDSVVPEKRSNNGGGAPSPAEGVEERGSAKGNSQRQSATGHSTGFGCNERWREYGRLRNGTRRWGESHPSILRAGSARHDPRQEPSAGNPLAGICAGGAWQRASLPRRHDGRCVQAATVGTKPVFRETSLRPRPSQAPADPIPLTGTSRAGQVRVRLTRCPPNRGRVTVTYVPGSFCYPCPGLHRLGHRLERVYNGNRIVTRNPSPGAESTSSSPPRFRTIE